ncbi:MAG: nicotinate (nicotinamide) nucleotide adenylyltransferase [Bacteroidales bacterium]
MKTGLFFGSFNPVHIGHLAIANYMCEFTDLEQVWFVVSPQNPFKDKKSLLPGHQRLEMVRLAIDDTIKYKASNIEFQLPQPSWTIDTLAYLYDKYPERNFALIMGSDNLPGFNKWKNYLEILKNHKIYVYPRPNNHYGEFGNHNSIIKVNAPLIEISSSFIRQSIKNGKDVRFFLPDKVWAYIKEMHFYEK